jgi:MraZ protein
VVKPILLLFHQTDKQNQKHHLQMLNLRGEYDCTLDSKGRIRLPSGLLKKLGERDKFEFVVNKGFEKHLTLYPLEVWEDTVKEFEKLNTYEKNAREFLRRFHNGVADIEMDDQMRVLIPKRLLEYAGLEKEVVLSAYGNKVEIWDATEYEKMISQDEVSMSSLAQEVLGKRNE